MNKHLILAAALPVAIGSLLHAQQQPPKPVPRAAYVQAINNRFATLDTNHDGTVSQTELAVELTREVKQAQAKVQETLITRFKQLDTNKDGQLSIQEFQVIAGPIRSTESPDQMLARLDSNHDGKVSADEYRAPELARFARVDANHDGIVTPAEVQAANKK